MESESWKGAQPSQGKKPRTPLFVTSVSSMSLCLCSLSFSICPLCISLCLVFGLFLCVLYLSLSLYIYHQSVTPAISLPLCESVSLHVSLYVSLYMHVSSSVSSLSFLSVFSGFHVPKSLSSRVSSHVPSSTFCCHTWFALRSQLRVGSQSLPYQLPVSGSGPESWVPLWVGLSQKVKLESQWLSWKFCAVTQVQLGGQRTHTCKPPTLTQM